MGWHNRGIVPRSIPCRGGVYPHPTITMEISRQAAENAKIPPMALFLHEEHDVRGSADFMRVPLFNLFEAGSVYLALFFYPRLRSLRSLSLGFLRIKPRRGFSEAAGNHHLGSRTGINPARRLCAALVVCADGCVP